MLLRLELRFGRNSSSQHLGSAPPYSRAHQRCRLKPSKQGLSEWRRPSSGSNRKGQRAPGYLAEECKSWNCIRSPEIRGTERLVPRKEIPTDRDSQELASRE